MTTTERMLRAVLRAILKRHGARGPCACPDCRLANAALVAVEAEQAARAIIGRA